MSISSIPLPQSGADAFLTGAAGTQNILSNILQGQQRNHQLAISQQAESRQQAQLPYVLQKFQDAHKEAVTMLPLYAQQYKDIHGKALSDAEQQKLYNDFIHARINAAMQGDQAGKGGQAPAPAGAPVPTTGGAPMANGQQAGAPQPTMPMPAQAQPQPQEYAGVPREQLQKYLESKQISPENAEQLRGFLNPSAQQAGGDMAPPGMAQPGMPVPQPQQVGNNMSPAAPQVSQGMPQPESANQPVAQQGSALQNPKETVLNPGDKTRYMEDSIAGLSVGGHKMPEIKTHYDQKNGLVIKTYPSGKITVQTYAQGKPGESANPNLQKALATQDAKLVDKLETNVASGYDTRATLNEIGKVVSNPAWDEMRQNPVLGSFELKAYANYGTPQQKEMVATYMANTGQIIADMAGRFKGQFRKGEQSLLESMKPSLSDTADVARGKTKALMLMNEMMIKRNSATANLIRNGMNPSDAMAKSDSELNGDLLRKMIEKQVGTPGKNDASVDRVTFVDSNGDEHTILKSNLDEARKRDPNLQVKEGS